MKTINPAKWNWFNEVVLVVCSLVVYITTLNNGFFCWDDAAVALNPANRQLSVHQILHTFGSSQVGLYHPVTTLSFMLDYAIGQGSPFTFHLTNILLHSLNTLLLYLFLRKLTGKINPAFLAALLFAIHPMHVESVAWVTSRKDLMYTLFYFLTLIFYLKYLEKDRSWKNYGWAVLCFAFSLMSKIQAVTLPFVLILIDFYLKKRPVAKMIPDKIPFFLLCIPFGLANYYAQQGYGYISYGFHFSGFEQVFLMFYAASVYLMKIVFPFPLSVFYSFPFSPGEGIQAKEMIVVAFFLLLLVSAVIFRKKIPRMAGFGIWFFLINSLIVAVVTQRREFVIADRYVYLSSVGVFLLIASIAEYLPKTPSLLKKSVVVVLTLYIGFLSVSAFHRSLLWKDPEKLFSQALCHDEDSEIILNTLATLEIGKGNYEAAREHLDRAISVSPDYSQAYYNRGIVFTKTQQADLAITDFSTAIRCKEDYTDAIFARGTVYMRKNEWVLAFDDFTRVLHYDPEHFGALQNRAIIRGGQNDFRGALEDLNMAVRVDPGTASTYYLRGIALFETGDNGCDDLRKALNMGYDKARQALVYYCE
ncbi:MAG TPA: tetratricopeptide repeat protein [Bacteroidales bacterium]|nr:tetratricopeptide repeat protein [Bacteroidales bacterium]HPS74699.1 tetratricopeptide repeat protein [Bacteroidales bacterium]